MNQWMDGQMDAVSMTCVCMAKPWVDALEQEQGHGRGQ